MPYYAVRVGRSPGVYGSWNECQAQVNGYSGSQFKKFSTETEAEDWITEDPSDPQSWSVMWSPVDARRRIDAAVEEDRFIVYVDGSIKESTPNSMGILVSWSLACFRGDQEVFRNHGIVEGPPELLRMRNVAGELTAALEASKHVASLGYTDRPTDDSIALVFDYRGIYQFINPVKADRFNTTKPWILTQYIPQMLRVLDNIDFIWVPGHTGIEGNELADKLASEAITDAIAKHMATY